MVGVVAHISQLVDECLCLTLVTCVIYLAGVQTICQQPEDTDAVTMWRSTTLLTILAICCDKCEKLFVNCIRS